MITAIGKIIKDKIVQPIVPREVNLRRLVPKGIVPNKTQMVSNASARNYFVDILPIYKIEFTLI